MTEVVNLLNEHFCCFFWFCVIYFMVCPCIKKWISNSHEIDLIDKKFEQEKWWKTQNDKDRDLKKILDDRIEELKKEIESNAKSNLTEQEILKAEHDFYQKILKDFPELIRKKND